jgi:flagellum-specific ATP synthase
MKQGIVRKPDWHVYQEALEAVPSMSFHGKVNQVVGSAIEAYGIDSFVGELCEIYTRGNKLPVKAEVVGFSGDRIVLMPLGEVDGIGPGSHITGLHRKTTIALGEGMLGRVVDGLGAPIDGKGPLCVEKASPLSAEPINPLHRDRIVEPLDVGIKAINGLLTCGKGQRMGIFSGSGVGKSVLLGMIARNTSADVNVIALIGERGREVREFIEKDLGEEGLKRSVVVVATSEQSPLVRMKGALSATTIAEYFRDKGNDVLFMMDSITRFAMAQREIGLAANEPPTTKGYTPSVFAMIPKLVERVGNHSEKGSITGLYTVLVDSDDLNEPISDAVRSVLDGHIVLSRDLANHNHYPAIDALASVSRSMIDITDPEHLHYARRLLSIVDTYRKAEDLINIGAYVSGSNPQIDYAISMIEKVNQFMQQSIEEQVGFDETFTMMKQLFN